MFVLMVLFPFLTLTPGTIWSQMVLGAPAKDFTLVMFDEITGYPTWALKGRVGSYVNSRQIDVSGLLLTMYSGFEDREVETTIRSPQASMLIDKGIALGNSEFSMEGFNYLIQGSHWIWYGKVKTLKVHRKAKVIFEGSLDYILK